MTVLCLCFAIVCLYVFASWISAQSFFHGSVLFQSACKYLMVHLSWSITWRRVSLLVCCSPPGSRVCPGCRWVAPDSKHSEELQVSGTIRKWAVCLLVQQLQQCIIYLVWSVKKELLKTTYFFFFILTFFFFRPNLLIPLWQGIFVTK